MTRSGRYVLFYWLLGLAACLTIVVRSNYTADMSAFLPQRPTAEQQLLVDQIREGTLSRLLLIGIEGSDAAGRARLSQALAANLQTSKAFSSVRNGDTTAFERDREILFAYRYLLSPAVTDDRFSIDGLRQSIGESIDLLASPAGLLFKNLLLADPTGEMMVLLANLNTRNSPATLNGVWVSQNGQRAMLMAQTAALGSDTDGQETALAALREAFASASKSTGIQNARLLYSGAPVFAVDSRTSIRSEVERLAILGASGIILVLLLVYRSLPTLMLGLLPVLTGALAGIAAVSLGFGSVHSITIGFGTTLIGEAVDYSIYYFIQSQAGQSDHLWQYSFWPTIRLGVLTSLCGFTSLLFSGFPGLSQLGLYTISGLVAAALVTRYVLPHLRPKHLSLPDLRSLGHRLQKWTGILSRFRWGVALLAGLSLLIVATSSKQLWGTNLADLSPLPAHTLALDQSLRADLGAPDQRFMIAVTGKDRESTLASAESIGEGLTGMLGGGSIAGFETPARFMPSESTQRMRQSALPSRAELTKRLERALEGIPLRPERLTPFLDAIEAARQIPLLTPPQLAGSSLAIGLDAMLLSGPTGWTALIPLEAPRNGPNAYRIDPTEIRQLLNKVGIPQALFIDLAAESNRMYEDYLNEAILLSLAGLLAIVVLLGISLRSGVRLTRVLAPLIAAVMVVIASLALANVQLNLLHLVGVLLIVAVGSNYSLFFDRPGSLDDSEPQTLASLVIANATTVIGFGILAFAKVPVLHAIGITVGPGAVLALLFSAIMARQPETTNMP